jgi:hypothetical protein
MHSREIDAGFDTARHRQLDALPHGRRPADHQTDNNGYDITGVFHPRRLSFAVQSHVLNQRLNGFTNRWLFANNQPYWAQIGQNAPLGKPQPKVIDSRHPCRGLQQPSNGTCRNLEVRISQACSRERDLVEHPIRIDPDGARDFNVVGQGCAASEIRHGQSSLPMSPDVKDPVP